MKKAIITLALCSWALATWGQSLRNQKCPSPIKIEKSGKITYNTDDKGGRIIDYSYCGYRMSETRIPDANVVVRISPTAGDQYSRLQKAIDYVANLKPDKQTGLRGAILLTEGIYNISHPLKINTSGIVLRGASKAGTVICKTGVDRGAVVYIEGKDNLKVTDTLNISDSYVPVGAKTFSISDAKGIKDNADIIVVRPSTKEWIQHIKCDVFGGGLGYWGWKPGEMDVRWQRRIAKVEGKSITLDAPLTVALDKQWGNSIALVYNHEGRISDSGIENISICANRTTDFDEDHAWDGIYINNAQDCWIRMVNFKNLAGSAVVVHRGAQQVTVEDCISTDPQSEVGGLRRRTFLTMGGKCLFLRCYSDNGINDFSAGYCAPGPNAFVQCDAMSSHGFSGGSSSWATGLLMDNVTVSDGGISFKNLGLDKWGAGWNTANSMMWQCSASTIDCYDVSEDARCYAIGCWSYCNGDGYWESVNNHIHPVSLFEAQLADRINAEYAKGLCRTLERNTDASSSPTVEKAALMAEEALKPRKTMEQWINDAVFTCDVTGEKAKDIDNIKAKDTKILAPAKAQVAITNNLFTLSNGEIMAGTFKRTPWWNGRTRYPYMDKADYAVTRFVPEMEQRGGTDRMDSVMVNLERHNVAIWNQNYGLWYDRRRDDHERISRPNGDVWAPFWEQVFKRSGEGKAWDGLSKYDLTRLNPWYISRVHELSEKASDMLVINQHYFQHNILEAGAHWVDAPWRTTNNINGTDFLEPVPFTGDKRIFTADAFYDVKHERRAALHRQYIHKMLDAFADRENVYHSISEEFTGPLHFTEFWLDCIAEWNAANGKHAHIILNTTKDVMHSIMNNIKYADIVDAIEIEQWWYYGDGNIYAPEGGKNLAPRQHMRVTKNGHPTALDCYRSVAEIRLAYPTKPVLYLAKGFDHNAWMVLFAGGSCPSLNIKSDKLLKAMATMTSEYPKDITQLQDSYVMKGEGTMLIYNIKGNSQSLPACKKAYEVNQKDGTLIEIKDKKVKENNIVFIEL